MAKGRTGRAYWAGVIAEFERSGQSHDRFCEKRKLNVGTFRSWLYRLRAEASVEAPRFVEVTAAPATASTRCIVRVGGAEIEFAPPPSAEYLAELVSALAPTTAPR